MEHILLDKLEKINQIDSINRGGCALVAYAMKEFMKKIDKKNRVTIYYIVCRYGQIYINNKAISCRHAVIKYKGKFYDSEGLIDGEHCTEENFTVRKFVKDYYVRKSLKDKYKWNSAFKRTSGLKKINKILGTNIRLKDL